MGKCKIANFSTHKIWHATKCNNHDYLSLSVLNISFGQSNYSIVEGSTFPRITLQFTTNQNSFNITLSAVTIDTAQSMGLGIFIDSNAIQRAATGMLTKIDS